MPLSLAISCRMLPKIIYYEYCLQILQQNVYQLPAAEQEKCNDSY